MIGTSFLSSMLVSQKAILAPSLIQIPVPIKKGNREIRIVFKFKVIKIFSESDKINSKF
jgi:hypothetical protein